jgi:hypothetical protein
MSNRKAGSGQAMGEIFCNGGCKATKQHLFPRQTFPKTFQNGRKANTQVSNIFSNSGMIIQRAENLPMTGQRAWHYAIITKT